MASSDYQTLCSANVISLKMGTWESKVKQTENDSEEMELIRWEILGSERAHSPEPVTPPPNNFSGLPMDEQFTYLKPVLKCILDGQFQPAKQRHEGFLKGGTERSNVAMMAGLRGDLDAHTVSVLSAYICRWVLRDDTFIKRSPGNGQQTQVLDSTGDASSPIAPVRLSHYLRIYLIYVTMKRSYHHHHP